MITVARTAVPIVVAGLLLTACGGGKSGTARLGDPPADGTLIAPAPDNPGSVVGKGSPMGAVGIDAAASWVAPVRSVLPKAAPVIAGSAALDSHTITTHGVGKATGIPDTLTMMIGVSTQGSSAKEALDANNSKAAALIDVLRRNGVESKDLQTRQLSINPTYNDKSGGITGYQVDDVVQATLHDIARAGALLDAAASVVGNAVRVQQIAFSVGDDTALRAQARAQAVSQARAHAAELAKAAGVSLGRIRSLTELVDGGYPISYDMGPAAAAGASVAAPVQAGQQELTISVDIVYDIG